MSLAIPLRLLRPAAKSLPLDRQEVLRYLGYRSGVTRVTAREQRLLDEGIRLATEAAVPVASVAYCAVTVDRLGVSARVPGLAWRSRTLADLLRGAEAVSVVAATLGPGVEDLTRELFREGQYALATVVDAAGTALVQALGCWIRTELEAEGPGLHLTPLYGPGYGDWPVEDLPGLLQAAGAETVGVGATQAFCLTPVKSLAGVMGWTASERSWTGCSLCRRRDCPYREAPAAGKERTGTWV